MSRTDAHQPYWTQARLWEPIHMRCPNAQGIGWYAMSLDRECDLPDGPVLPRDRQHHTRWRNKSCYWTPVWSSITERHYSRAYAPVPKWFVDHRWNNVERTRQRCVFREMTKLLRAGEDTDFDFPCWQTRHGAKWDWE